MNLYQRYKKDRELLKRHLLEAIAQKYRRAVSSDKPEDKLLVRKMIIQNYFSN